MTRYRHADGFKDGTDYIEIGPDGKAWVVTDSGKRIETSSYSRAYCESRVAAGIWMATDAPDDGLAKERTP